MTDTQQTQSQIRPWLPAIIVAAAVLIAALVFHQQIIGWFGGGGPNATVEAGEFQTAGPFRVAVAIDPPQPRVGENQITIVVQDAEGKPVTGAEVQVVAVMPAMGTMPEMRETARIEEIGDGRYSGAIDLSMAGAWPLTVSIESPGGTARLTFDMSTQRAGLRPTGGATIADPDPNAIAYHTCPMHPSVKSKRPDECPLCGMDLEPVTHGELASGTIFVDAQRRQLIGVRTQPAEMRQLVKQVRALGIVTYDETRLTDVSLKYRGWIGEQQANYVGQKVEEGQPLMTIYSPELLTAQQEYLDALGTGRNERLLAAARTRLLLWDFGEQQIKELETRGSPGQYVPIFSPATGTVVEKNGVRGSAVEAASRVYRIADLSVVWIEAELYESEIPLIDLGHEVSVELSYLPGRQFTGKVSYIYPYLDEKTRRGRVRIEAENPEGLLKPDMYADVRFELPLGERLAVPEEAILYAGESNIVFLDLDEGKMRPQRIKTGLRAGDWVEVLEGIEPGDVVVTSGNFLIASESKLKTGIAKW